MGEITIYFIALCITLCVFLPTLLLNSEPPLYNCLSGAGYMEECQECQDRNMSYAMCSGFCYDVDEVNCGVNRGDCCYNNYLFLKQSAMGTKCSYKWGLYGYLKTKQSLEIWQQEMIEEYC